MKAYNTTDWPIERLRDYGPDITAAMRQLVERFPHDLTVEALFEEFASGRRQLWLVLDGDRFVSFGMTELKVIEATGHKICMGTDLAGSDGVASVPLIAEVEKWAAEQGCDEVAITGRGGWTRALSAQGYRPSVTIFRKTLET